MFQKTYQQFISEARRIGRHEAALLNRMGGLNSYPGGDTEERLQAAKELDAKEKEKEDEETSRRLYHERTRGRGIRATDKKGRTGWIKNGVFTPGDW